MTFTYIDGDNIGLRIETSFLENDERSLIAVNEMVKYSIETITDFLIYHNQSIIFSGADGIICKGQHLDINNLIDFIRTTISEISFSIGVGKNLKDCYVALRYAKAKQKNIGVEYFKGEFEIIY